MKILRFLLTLAFVLGGIALLCAPSHAQAAKPFTPTRFTITDEGTAGKPDVVLIPGLASSKAVWDGEARLLSPNYRLHVVQIDGFAGAPVGPNSTGPFLAPIVEELHAYIVTNRIHPVVMGHSLGGLLALLLADKHPEDASKLIIVDSLPFYAVIFNANATVESMKPQVDAIRQRLLDAPADQFAAMQPTMAAAMVKNADAQKLVAASSIASDRTVFANAMSEDMETDLRGDVATIKTPTLMLYPYDSTAQGSDPAKVDKFYTTAYAAKPNTKLVRIDDSRHFIMYDQPQKLDAAVEAFLK
jgi:pimeloyl-ACP methyl ester carboxylesterase